MLYAIGLTVVILMVAVGLGFVIFVHELGHFLVAKACGVKCEKFYLGFDIGGWKLCKFQWGETEYGIGILPLGGYVKMLGQEDNPSKLAEEIERAKKGDEGRVAGDGGDAPNAEQAPTSESPAYDPRSFLAKSVPQRMAIISAGVIMNVIFAFFMAVVAYSLGVEQIPCVIGTVFPGEPAWQADLQPGDEILQIAGKKMSQFRDLQAAISLGNIPEEGVPLLVRRPGVKEPMRVMVKPDRSRGAFVIGVGSGVTTRLPSGTATWLVHHRPFVVPGSAADRASPPFENGDKVVKIDGVPTANYAQINEQLARNADRKITVTVERANASSAVDISVGPEPMRIIGLEMEMGPITAIQADSPAAEAGVQPGDRIESIDGNPPGDPMTLADRLRRRAGQKIKMTVLRGESKTPVTLTMQVRQGAQCSAPPIIVNSPVAVDAIGVAYHVIASVQHVADGSPAAKADLKPGDVLLSTTLNPPSEETLRKLQFEQPKSTVPLGEDAHNWPYVISFLQSCVPDTTVSLTFTRGDKKQTVEDLAPIASSDWFNPDRGLLFEPLTVDRKADSFADALALGGRETLDQVTLVYRTLKAIGTNRVSARNLGGPVMIAKVAAAYADRGSAELLIFLTMLERQPRRVEHPADPGAGRRTSHVPGLRRRPRQAGQRTRADRADLHRPGIDHRLDGLGDGPGLWAHLAAIGRQTAPRRHEGYGDGRSSYVRTGLLQIRPLSLWERGRG